MLRKLTYFLKNRASNGVKNFPVYYLKYYFIIEPGPVIA